MKLIKADLPFKILVDWYLLNKRPLPWRSPVIPYHIYIAEIVFQQTRIEQGLNFYNNIIERYPNFESLAEAKEKDFLKIWQGLGYYSRAHNILRTAKIIAQEYNGELPASYKLLASLPGIGPYTAAAIASIAFGQPFPVVDGNVKRVISRLFCLNSPIDKPTLTSEIQNLLGERIIHFNPSDFNQSLMDLGSMVCTPAKPDCHNCPLEKHCCAFMNHSIDKFPVKAAPKTKQVVFIQYYIVFTDKRKQSFYLVQRSNEKIWKGLFEFPCIITDASGTVVHSNPSAFPAMFPFSKAIQTFSCSHNLTHRQIKATFYEIEYAGTAPEHWQKTNIKEAMTIPVHRMIQQYLARYMKIAEK